MNKNIDYNFGLDKEGEIFEKLKSKFGDDLKKSEDKYSLFDYYSDTCYVELKSRRCSSHTYPDTMIGKNKIDFASTSDKPVYFIFSYNDGLFWYQYNSEEVIRSMEIRQGGRRDRGKPEVKDYCFIKTEFLKRI